MGRYEEALTAVQQALAAYRTLPGTERQLVDAYAAVKMAKIPDTQ